MSNTPPELKDELNNIIDENLDEILEVIKSKLPPYESEPDYVIMKALKEYFK